MSEHAAEPSRSRWRRWAMPAAWVALLVALIAWAVWRIELFPLSTTVLIDTTLVTEPRAYFTVDHPFHTARADLIARSWEGLETVRWVGSHHGGYPAEFNPFGVPAITALVTLLSGKALAIAASWALTITVLLLLPVAGYLMLAWHDRLSPAVPLIAVAGQVTIASDWTHGGYSELVEWGLATNVAGATYALLALPLLLRAAEARDARWVALAAGAVALCAVSNPRSLIAVAVVAIAVLAVAVPEGDLRRALLRIGGTALLAVGLSAPVVMPLLRYSDLYFFLSYQEYASAGEYLSETVESVTWPVLALAVAGAILAFWRTDHRASRASVITCGLYVALTALAVAMPGLREVIPQLELPRLMPFQRLLTLWLAAYGLMRLVGLIRADRTAWRAMGVAVTTTVALAVVFTTAAGPFPPEDRGLRGAPRTEGADAVELIQFRAAVEEAAAISLPDTAVLVLGSRLSWHEQLWAPMVAGSRRFLYNDWLWYWHRLHAGPYDYRNGHFYPEPGDALDPEYLTTHGVGAVMVTDVADARSRSASSPQLEHVSTIGAWDVYRVVSPVGIATLDGASPDTSEVSDDFERITVAFEDAAPGTLLVRQNWFPRWEATVNGEPVPVERGESGYIEVPVKEGGAVRVELAYAVTTADAVARGVAMAAGVAALLVLLVVRPISRWTRR